MRLQGLLGYFGPILEDLGPIHESRRPIFGLSIKLEGKFGGIEYTYPGASWLLSGVGGPNGADLWGSEAYLGGLRPVYGGSVEYLCLSLAYPGRSEAYPNYP